jgi:hypothetical protein
MYSEPSCGLICDYRAAYAIGVLEGDWRGTVVQKNGLFCDVRLLFVGDFATYPPSLASIFVPKSTREVPEVQLVLTPCTLLTTNSIVNSMVYIQVIALGLDTLNG